jgi:tetratricopeptide (TPR) repeat protein
MDPWNLIEEGHYAEAVNAFTKRLRRDRCGPNYCNRGIAYLNLGDYDKALADFRAADECFEYTSDGYLQSVGVAHWLAGRESEAVAVWQDLVLATERGKIQYTDGAGGVESACLLWFAGARLGQENLLGVAQRVLKNKLKTKTGRNWSIDNWPGPVAKFLLGTLDERRLRERIDDVPILRERELCQAEFYIGVRALQLRENVAAKSAFRRAAQLDAAKLENEYYLAKHESKRRGPRLSSR